MSERHCSSYIRSFLKKSDSERILKIGLQMPKLSSKVKCIVFFLVTVYITSTNAIMLEVLSCNSYVVFILCYICTITDLFCYM